MTKIMNKLLGKRVDLLPNHRFSSGKVVFTGNLILKLKK